MAKWFLIELPGEEMQPLPTQQGSPLLLVGSVSSTDENPALTRRWLEYHGVDLRWSEFTPAPPGGRFERCLFPERVAHALLQWKLKDEAPVTVEVGYSVAGVRSLLQGLSPETSSVLQLFTREAFLTPATPERVTLLLLCLRLLLTRPPSSEGASAVAAMY